MDTKSLSFIKEPTVRGIMWWVRFYKKHIMSHFFDASEQVDDSWKTIKIAKTETPKGMPSDVNARWKWIENEYKKDKIVLELPNSKWHTNL